MLRLAIISISLLISAIIAVKFLVSRRSPLINTIDQWISAPESYQDLTKINDNIRQLNVNSKAEAEAVCRGLKHLQSQFSSGYYANLNKNLYTLAVLFQQAKQRDAQQVLNDQGIPLLIANFNEYQKAPKEQIEKDSFTEPDLFILKMFALYPNPEGAEVLINTVKANYKPDKYMWSVIFNITIDKCDLIIKELGGFIPEGFAGVCYLDMCNQAAIQGKIKEHPFDNERGFQILCRLLLNQDKDEYSYAVSATAALPFISQEYQQQLLKLASNHPDSNVRIESAWAGAKLGIDYSLQQLVKFAEDYRYGHKPVEYLKELGKESMIPAQTKQEEFQALAEMCNWLSHPQEYGSYPDEASIVDKRDLFWPPTRDRRRLYIIKYTYKAHNEDGTDDNGVGLVGSTTFSMFGIEGLTEYPPAEVYAIHCAWEMNRKDYSNPEIGLKILRKYNKDL